MAARKKKRKDDRKNHHGKPVAVEASERAELCDWVAGRRRGLVNGAIFNAYATGKPWIAEALAAGRFVVYRRDDPDDSPWRPPRNAARDDGRFAASSPLQLLAAFDYDLERVVGWPGLVALRRRWGEEAKLFSDQSTQVERRDALKHIGLDAARRALAGDGVAVDELRHAVAELRDEPPLPRQTVEDVVKKVRGTQGQTDASVDKLSRPRVLLESLAGDTSGARKRSAPRKRR